MGDVKSRIAGRLRAAIESGRYQQGDSLPSTNELAVEEDAAAMTVRAAYAQLISEGLVVAVPRKGFFVRETFQMTWHMNHWQDPRRLNHLPVDAWTADVEAAGYSGRQSIDLSMVTAAHKLAGHSLGELLGLASGEPVTVRRRVRYLGTAPDQPATDPESIADSYYPHALVRDSNITLPESVNTAATLYELGAGLHHYDDELIPRIATQEEASTLQLPAVTAVLEIVRIGFTADDRPVLVQHMIRPGQGNSYRYHVPYPTDSEGAS
jgi:GntR family transcriptional regulator